MEDKTNEITAIPKLLDGLSVEHSTVSLDAMGCQKEIARKIVDGKGDYLLSLKGNHGNAFRDAEWLFGQSTESSAHSTIEYDRSRPESRRCSVLHLSGSQKRLFPGWKELEPLVRIESSTERQGVQSHEIRYYMSSHKNASPQMLGSLVRSHWSIENQLHWHLDVTFGEDASQIKKGHAPENMNLLRKMALQRVGKVNDKLSIQKRRYKASLNTQYFEQILKL